MEGIRIRARIQRGEKEKKKSNLEMGQQFP